MRRNPPARTATIVTGLLVAATLAPTPARAEAPLAAPDVAVSAGISGLQASALADSLGSSRTGGVYLNADGRMVVTVTDGAAARAVSAAGGVPQLVAFSAATLRSIHTELDRHAGIPGTSWGVDPSTNQVSVELDSTVSKADAARLAAVTGRFGTAVRVDRIPGKLQKAEIYTSGGDSIRNRFSSLFCSIGFNVQTSSGNRHFLTAGHCAEGTQQWYDSASGEYLGNRVSVSWPGNDYAVIDYTQSDVTAYGTVNDDTEQISSSRNPVDGESVKRAGATSNDFVGAVLLTSTTVTYDSGETVTGMIKTSLCVMGGDSGGPLYHGTAALGITSGGTDTSAPCSSGVSNRRSYFQPVQEALNSRGLSVY